MYDAELNGQDVTFGTSGFLYQNNKLMYDRQTKTLWHSLTGEPVVGELAHSGQVLKRFPVTVTTWDEWIQQHPDSTVVSLDTGYVRRYLAPSDIGSAYYVYRNSPDAMFPTFAVDSRLAEKDSVVGIALDGESMAFPVDRVVSERVINTKVGDAEVVLIGDPLRGVVGVFERGGLIFETIVLNTDGRTVADDSGVLWTAGDDALVSTEGESLARLPTRELFWFGWAAFFPGTEVYGDAKTGR